MPTTLERTAHHEAAHFVLWHDYRSGVGRSADPTLLVSFPAQAHSGVFIGGPKTRSIDT